MKYVDITTLILTVVGAVNWGLVGFFQFDLVAFILGEMTFLSRIVYSLVGISGIYVAVNINKYFDKG